MSFTKSLFNCITFLLVMFLSVELKADENKSKEEPLPLNDPFVGDASLSGGVKVLSDGTTSSEQKRLDIFTLVAIFLSRITPNSLLKKSKF